MLTLRPYQTDIVRAVHESWRTGHKRPLVCLPTGGGKTALAADMCRRIAEAGTTAWFLVHRRELMKQTLDTFTLFDIPLDRIHVGMVWTALRQEWPEPDLIIYDECHHATSLTWQRITDAHPDAFMTGLTATPARLDGKALGDVFDKLVLGPTTQDLINQGYLSPYRMIVADVADLTGLRTRGSDYDRTDAESRLMERAVYGDVVKAYQKWGQAQAIYFCTTIRHSEATAEAFQAAGIRAEHFDGNTPSKDRDRLIEQFRAGSIQILCNCELIGEGFDMPACDVVGMLRPTQSLTVYLQQVGRALRPRDGKQATLIDHVGNISRHGSPSEPRAWSLEGRIKTGRAVTEEGEFAIRYCQECYAAYEVTKPRCPVCGAEYVSTMEEIKQIRDVRMKVLEETQLAREKAWALSEEAEREAESYSELCTIAKHRGYKTGWAYHRAKARGLWVPY